MAAEEQAGVDVEKGEERVRPIEEVSTSVAAFVDTFARGPVDEAVRVTSWEEFEQRFGGLDPSSEASYAVRQYFLNGGSEAWVVRVLTRGGDEPGSPARSASAAAAIVGDADEQTGMHALTAITPRIFNLLCIPAAAELGEPEAVYSEALELCSEHRAMLLVDVPADRNDRGRILDWDALEALRSPDAALYFPRLSVPDPLADLAPREVGCSGTVAGIYARTDAASGVWTAPAGTDATCIDADPTMSMTDEQNRSLSARGINAIRQLTGYGTVVWGSRTLAGADAAGSVWKYVPVRRLALFIEESVYRGTEWAAFEPNDKRLWARIRASIGAFMQSLFSQGAFMGTTADDGYFVICDSSTTTRDDIDEGFVNVVIGFAPVWPAEFIILRIQQRAAQA